MKKTIIDGHETWWAVCCQHECSSVYWGPYFDDDEWLEREIHGAGCEYAHFKARYVPEHASVRFGNHTSYSATDAGVDIRPVSEWLREHEIKAREHVNFRAPKRTADAHEQAEKVLTEAVQS